MMKRIACIATVLALMSGSAMAAVLTDAPSTPTQDRAVTVTATLEDEEKTAYNLEELAPDQLTMKNAMDVFYFVYEEGNRPVNWYPEETQEAISEMVDVDPESLRMTEFMRLRASDTEVTSDLDAKMSLTIDYQPGQLTVVVLGDTSDPDNIVWTPVESTVTETGVVEFTVPQSLMEQLKSNDILLTLMTERTKKVQKQEVVVETTEVPETLPSKSADDTTRVVKTVSSSGKVLDDDFELVVVTETEVIQREVEMIGNYVTEENKPAITWLPEEDQNRVRYLLGVDADTDSLIVSDYVSLITEDFKPTEGAAIGTLSFATPYEEGQLIVTALGTPKAEATQDGETQMDWSVQPAIVREGGIVDVIFDQLALIDMGSDAGLLLMFSAPTATAE